MPPDVTNDEDIVYWDSCDVCAEELFVLQKDLDELEHMNYNMDKDVVYGVCLSCGQGFNMTELIPEVLLAEAD